MTLKEANEELEKLDNEYNYWLKEKEIALGMVLPRATNVRLERVDGGNREERLLKYVEVLDNKKIDETLDYIFRRQQNLMKYIDEELKILGEYEPIERKIIELRNEKNMKWKEIALNIGYCERQCQRIYDKYFKRKTKKRNYRMS